jgi:hypothetical protein
MAYLMKRNPRRAYDKQGREIEPMTLGNMRSIRVRSVSATCDACSHEGVVNCDRWPEDLPVPDVALRLRCSQCGSKAIKATLHMPEYYETAAVVRL